MGAAIVLLVRPLTPEVTLWTAIGALIAVVLLELLQRPPAVEVDGQAMTESAPPSKAHP